MAREKEGFRETLDRLDAYAPGKEFLTRSELSKFIGVSKSTVQRNWMSIYNPIVRGYPKVLIARAIVSV